MDESRKRPLFPRDRDQRQTTSPTPGSSAARAIHGVPREQWENAKTPVNAPDLETLMFRSAVTKQHAMQASADIAAVRTEFQNADQRLDKKLDEHAAKLDEQGKHITELRIAVGKSDSKLDVMTGMLREQLTAKNDAQRTKLGWVTKLIAGAISIALAIIGLYEMGRC